jgi:hypothetical protein
MIIKLALLHVREIDFLRFGLSADHRNIISAMPDGGIVHVKSKIQNQKLKGIPES